MYPAKFDYYRADTVQDAIRLLQEHPDAKLLAGGHSLLPMMKLRLAQPEVLVDVARIEALSGITSESGGLRIGALTTHAAIAASTVVAQHCPILAEAASQIADIQVRNKGTIGGNLVHADPGSDFPAVLVALGGTFHLTGPDGTREVAASDFFLDLLMTDLQPAEILTEITVPTPAEGSGGCYLKMEHPASGYAICGAAALVRLSSGESAAECRLCFNGVNPVPLAATAVESALAGSALDDDAIDRAVDDHLAVSDPMGDLYASGPYRVTVAKVLGKRALKAARDRAKS